MSRSIRLRFVIIIITQRAGSLVTQLVMEKKEKKREAPLSLFLSGSKAALSFHDARSSSASSQSVER